MKISWRPLHSLTRTYRSVRYGIRFREAETQAVAKHLSGLTAHWLNAITQHRFNPEKTPGLVTEWPPDLRYPTSDELSRMKRTLDFRLSQNPAFAHLQCGDCGQRGSRIRVELTRRPESTVV